MNGWAPNQRRLSRGRKIVSKPRAGGGGGVGLTHTATFWSRALRSLRNQLEPGHPGYFGGILVKAGGENLVIQQSVGMTHNC